MNVITNNNIQSTIALAALQNVVDPEIGLNIVDLGLVYQLDFDENDMKIFCTITLTSQFCPMGETILNAAKEMLKDTFASYHVSIGLTFEPAWNYEMISAEGRKFLNKN